MPDPAILKTILIWICNFFNYLNSHQFKKSRVFFSKKSFENGNLWLLNDTVFFHFNAILTPRSGSGSQVDSGWVLLLSTLKFWSDSKIPTQNPMKFILSTGTTFREKKFVKTRNFFILEAALFPRNNVLLFLFFSYFLFKHQFYVASRSKSGSTILLQALKTFVDSDSQHIHLRSTVGTGTKVIKRRNYRELTCRHRRETWGWSQCVSGSPGEPGRTGCSPPRAETSNLYAHSNT